MGQYLSFIRDVMNLTGCIFYSFAVLMIVDLSGSAWCFEIRSKLLKSDSLYCGRRHMHCRLKMTPIEKVL